MRRSVKTRILLQQQGEAGVSLFPFLAVLICTLGSLILLLIIVARQGRLYAAQAAVADTAGQAQDFESARGMVRWEVENLKESREKTETDLASERLELGHLEEHSHRLARQIAQLQATWKQLDQLEADGSRRHGDLSAELARLKAQIANSQQELTELQRSAADRRPSYAVIPYEGPNSTRRRPIYIDCRTDSVVLEPEGVVLTEADFTGPLGPGNPLEVALRAQREHLIQEQRDQGIQEPEEPYPLLLVRPDGIAAYYAARAAMESWGSDFGYELIGEDWRLKYPPADPSLADAVREAVYTARARLRLMAAAAPGYYGSDDRPSFVARPRGGIMRQDGREGDGHPSMSGGPPRGFGRTPAARGSQNKGGNPPKGGIVGRPQASSESPTAVAGTPRRPGEWQPSDPRAKPPGEAEASDQPNSLAATRGRNWGLPDAADNSIPLTRPIRIDCYHDRLVIVPEAGMGREQVIPLGPRAEASIDSFISAVWDNMDAWGIAGKGMYWRPVLNVHVAPDAAHRYREMAILLDGSGLEVKPSDQR